MNTIPKIYSKERMIWLIINSLILLLFSIQVCLSLYREVMFSSKNLLRNSIAFASAAFVGIIAISLLIIAIYIFLLAIKQKLEIIPDSIPYFKILVGELIGAIFAGMILDGGMMFGLVLAGSFLLNLALLVCPIETKCKNA